MHDMFHKSQKLPDLSLSDERFVCIKKPFAYILFIVWFMNEEIVILLLNKPYNLVDNLVLDIPTPLFSPLQTVLIQTLITFTFYASQFAGQPVSKSVEKKIMTEGELRHSRVVIILPANA